MSELLERFFADFASNERALRAMGYDASSQRLQLLRQEAALDTDHTYVVATPADDGHLLLRERIGVKVSYYRDGGIVNLPVALRWHDGEIWVGSRSAPIARFDANWSYLGGWSGLYGYNIDAGRYRNIADFAIDPVNGRLFVVMYNRARAYDLDTGAALWTWGSGAAGNYADNRPNNPTSIEVLPNGNVLVAVYSGYGPANGNSPGYVAELDGATGAPVACRLEGKTDGAPWKGEVTRPRKVRVYGSLAYVALETYGGGIIGVYDTGTWEYVRSYARPAGFNVGAILPVALCLDEPDPAAATELVVVASGPQVIVGLGLDDHDYKWHAGELGWDDRPRAANRPGEVYQMRDVLPLGDGLFAVADRGNNRVTVLPRFNYAEVPYDVPVPPGFELVERALPDGFDAATGVLRVKLPGLADVGPLHLPCRRAV